MSLDDLRERVSDVISDEACSAEFYFLLEENCNISIKRADIDQAASDELAGNFINAISNTILLDDEQSLLDISSADDRAKAIYRYDLPEVPPKIQHLATILQRDDFDFFNFEADDLEHLKGILIILGHGQQQLALYKHQYMDGLEGSVLKNVTSLQSDRDFITGIVQPIDFGAGA